MILKLTEFKKGEAFYVLIISQLKLSHFEPFSGFFRSFCRSILINYTSLIYSVLKEKFGQMGINSYFCTRNFKRNGGGMFTPCLISTSIPFYKRGTQKNTAKW